jgi:aspartate 1-decarboxylase
VSRGSPFPMGVMIACALASIVTNASLNAAGVGVATGVSVGVAGVATATPALTVLTTTLKLTSVNNGQTFKNYRIRTTNGDCVDLNGASNVTLENFDIGPCAGRGVYIGGGSGNNLYDNYIHVEGAASRCCDSRDGVFVNGSNSGTIQGNVIAYSETNVQTFNANDTVITGNFLLNPQGPFPRGQQIQTGPGRRIRIVNNFLVSTRDSTLGPAIRTSSSASILLGQGTANGPPSDNLNIYTTQNADVENNYITGGLDATMPGSGGAQAAAGCGLIADASNTLASNNAIFKNNILVNTGQCAIGIASGANLTVTGNKSISLNPKSGGQTADYIWKQYTPLCGPVMLSGNIGTLIRSNAYASGYWNGGGCDPVTCDGTNTNIDSCNTFDYGGRRTAYNALIADPAVSKPPLIPPQPKNCVANSPYSTQTSLPPCGRGV